MPRMSENQKKVLRRSCDKLIQLVNNVNCPSGAECILRDGGSINMQTEWDDLLGEFYTIVEVTQTRYLPNEIHIFKMSSRFTHSNAKETPLEDVISFLSWGLWRVMHKKYGGMWPYEKGEKIVNNPLLSAPNSEVTVFLCNELDDLARAIDRRAIADNSCASADNSRGKENMDTE